MRKTPNHELARIVRAAALRGRLCPIHGIEREGRTCADCIVERIFQISLSNLAARGPGFNYNLHD